MMTPENPNLIFVLGGARSGKSAFAENLIAQWPSPWIYIATAEAYDDEMREKIALHRARRDARWQTVNAPERLAHAIDAAPLVAPVLIDCLTLWLSNIMLAERNCAEEMRVVLAALSRRKAPTLIVSNEVGLGVVPDNALARKFRNVAGLAHQSLAAAAGQAHFIVAGLPIKLK